MGITIYCGKCRCGPFPMIDFEEVIINGDPIYLCRDCAKKEQKPS